MTVVDTPETPLIPLSAPVNLRDLGGIPVAGGHVREGFAIRSDDLSTVTEEVAASLVDRGLRSVIDLRSTPEVTVTGRGPLGSRSEVDYHHVPFMADISAGAEEPLDHSSLGTLYLRMYEQAAGQIVTALAIIAHAPGTVAFHCAAGQDRTGVLAASILLALGAEADDVIADYARTGENSDAIMERISPLIGPLMARLGMDLDAAARAASTGRGFSTAPMQGLIAEMTERHGDPLAPLRAAGLSDALVERLRERAIAR